MPGDLLYQHQIEGAEWLAARARGLLTDRPGLGKTRTLLAALNASAPDMHACAVVCPAIVRGHWRREAWTLGIENLPVYSYDAVVRNPKLVDCANDTLILDEAHYLKNGGALRTKVLLGKNGIARRAKRVYAASGTPMPKHPGELWPSVASLFPTVAARYGLNKKADWLAKFCETQTRFIRGMPVQKVVGIRNVELLRRILDEISLGRTLDDVGIDVPRVWWQTVRLDAPPEAAPYRQGAEVTDENREIFDVLSQHVQTHGVLADIAADPHIARMRRRLGEIKAPIVADMLADQLAESHEKVVVFAHHRSVLDILRAMLGRFGVAYVDGDTPQSKRDLLIHTFQTNPAMRVFLGQTIACQTGITLTAASRVVLVEPDWTAVVNDQAAHRVARIGQTADRCIAQMVCLAGTLDEAIVGQCAREVRMAEQVFGA